MKPNFALNLSHEGISLLHRAKAGWMAVGAVQLDAPDLNQQLSVLRKTAANLDQAGLASKLIIPNSQILYTELDAPGPSKKARIAQIRKGLVGLTPYEVDDLVFDWRVDGPKVQVAVVARETLKEAEAFAADFRFNPVSFVGNASPANFDGEPFFGPTDGADVILVKGDAVEPDDVAMKIVAPSKASTTPKPSPQAPDDEVEIADLVEESPVADTPEPPAPPKKKPAKAKKPKTVAPPAPETPDTSTPEPERFPEAVNRAEPLPEPEAPPPTPSSPTPSFASRRANAAEVPPEPSTKSRAQVARYSALDLDDVPDMPAWRDAKLGDPRDSLAVTSAQTADPQPAEIPAAKPKFALTGKVVGNALRPKERKAAIAASSKEAKAMTVFGERTKSKAVGGKPRFLGLMLTLLLLLALGVAALWSSLFLGTANDGSIGPEIGSLETTSPITPVETATIETGPSVVTSTPSVIAPSTENSGLTTPNPDTNPLSNAINNAVSTALTGEPAPETTPVSGDSAAPLTPTPEVAPAIEVARLEDTNPADLNATTAPPDRIVQSPPSMAEAERRYAITGIWELDPTPLADPTSTSPLENLTFASIDVALQPTVPSPPQNANPDQRPPTLLPPRKLLSSFNLDSRGLIPATAEGALSPDGTLVYLGLPPLVPGIRPGTVLPTPIPVPDTGVLATPTPEADSAPDVTPEVARLATPDTTIVPDASVPVETIETVETPAIEEPLVQPALTPEQELLREFRPVARPGSLEETFNQAPNGEGFTETELASIRPIVRPPSIQEEVAADEPEPDPIPGTTGDEEDSEENAETIPDPGTRLAINASSLPRGRPAAIERAAAKYLEQRRNTPPPKREVEVAAVVTPSIPSRASVARAATETNAIKLNKVNLIGVYGSSSDRRALVRLKNGRYVKVEVGDRVDGGRVAAISASELRYVKSGRTIALKMPKG